MKAEKIVSMCLSQSINFSVAESCTGGLISDAFVSVPGVSNVFTEGLVTYSNSSKIKRLDVKEETIKKYGAVSEKTVREMLSGLSTEHGIAVSGLAGPEGGTEEKPVGTVFVGVKSKQNLKIERFLIKGDRGKIRKKTRDKALSMFEKLLEKAP
ncbi:MAG: CinA family protein [bacterium]